MNLESFSSSTAPFAHERSENKDQEKYWECECGAHNPIGFKKCWGRFRPYCPQNHHYKRDRN